jgi:AraC-like DNA-binding protein
VRPPDLIYRRSPPESALRDYVEHLWQIRAPGDATTKREILIPNGRPTLVVCLAEPGVRSDPLTGTRHPNDTVLFGITTRPHVLEQRGPSCYVGAQLTPWALSALLPQDRLVDTFLPVREWLGADATAGLVAAVRDGGAEPAVLGGFLRGRLTPLPAGTLALLDAAVTSIERSHGQVAVADLASSLNLSHSALYRLFKAHLGIGPKGFAEITRYYHFVGGLLGADRADSTALLAALHGYYDQAHAARSFKRFTGVSAGAFTELLDGIARLMHAG